MKYIPFLCIAVIVTATGCANKNETKPERKTIVDAVFGSGHLENASQYTVMANAEGFIASSYVVEGDTVRAGQPLFRLSNEVQQTQVANARVNLEYAQGNAAQSSPQIQQLQAQIVQAQHKVQVDSTNYARYSRLVKTQAVSASDYENARLNYQSASSSLEVLQKNLADLQRTLHLNVDNAASQYRIQQENNNYYTLQSTGAGVVMNIAKKTGDFVKKGEQLALLGAGNIIMKLDIAEEDIERVKPGQRVLVSLNSDKNKIYDARITKIYPAFNATDQSFIAEAVFVHLPFQPLNGTQLQANIIIGEKQQALVIPSYSLQDGDYVYVGKEKKKVTVGIRTLEYTEITAGLNDNDIITLPKKK
ncbi:Barrel-sandwich domain of CusB or HlyD membrane-fusion [Filimonas lacunae]|uniref:Barrel-sandwich domain of CusB or HlyD membrane-fusion n=1 Tax=Filimonas lacunae TaxID=477680 RepID=A0A173MJ32_9BACT|nr:efflux RND transporter periplasmic adaptor subunit [Filimonas lacunae]BAV07489.1 RND efflux membrane fusion protein [Filimonas lacunae]SIT30191.1 Barrel-sandwich domain of CusB or HlyD membrane-fusion [Filimonas lacunae]